MRGRGKSSQRAVSRTAHGLLVLPSHQEELRSGGLDDWCACRSVERRADFIVGHVGRVGQRRTGCGGHIDDNGDRVRGLRS